MCVLLSKASDFMFAGENTMLSGGLGVRFLAMLFDLSRPITTGLSTDPGGEVWDTVTSAEVVNVGKDDALTDVLSVLVTATVAEREVPSVELLDKFDLSKKRKDILKNLLAIFLNKAQSHKFHI